MLFAAGGGISHTRGRFAGSIEVPAAGSVVNLRPWNFEAGDLVRAARRYGRADAKALEFGERDGPHLDVETIQARLDLAPTSSVRAEFKGIDISLALSDADSFISSLSQELKTRFDLALVYDRERAAVRGRPDAKNPPSRRHPRHPVGAHAVAAGSSRAGATTSGGLEANLPPSVTQFGPFRIQKGDRDRRQPRRRRRHRARARHQRRHQHRPVQPDHRPDRHALDLRAGGVEPNLGLVDMDFGFKPPNGIGVTIDAKAIKGGGFLYLDADKGEYAGVLELSFKGMTVKALGLLNTKAPAPAGWSLLLMLSAEFRETPWQIGLGFNITPSAASSGCSTGLGRPAAHSLGTNAFDDVLFPTDPVKNAPRILGRLRTLFPVQARALMVGPTVEVNWADAAARRRASWDSRAVHRRVRRRRVPLHPADRDRHRQGGGAARDDRCAAARRPHGRPPRRLRRRVGAARDRRAAARLEARRGRVQRLADREGRPRRQPGLCDRGGRLPPGVRRPAARAAGADRPARPGWKIGDSVVLTLQAYAAMTASSWQLGAPFTLRADIGPVDIDGGAGLRRDRLRRRAVQRRHPRPRQDPLARPHPDGRRDQGVLDRNANQVWHAAGTAKFSILWWDKEVDFEETWGTAKSLPPAPQVDAAALLRAGLSDPANWRPAAGPRRRAGHARRAATGRRG